MLKSILLSIKQSKSVLINRSTIVININRSMSNITNTTTATTAPTAVISAKSFNAANRLQQFLAPTVWHEFTPLALKHSAINLGQGFPGWSPPEFVRESAAAAVMETNIGADYMQNQYARPAGSVILVNQLAKLYNERNQSISAKSGISLPTIDPLTNILITDGATEALCCMMLGVLNEGDEVVVIEPAFDIYIAQTEMCGAKLRSVPLIASINPNTGAQHWTVDLNQLKSVFNDKTRLFILNTPQNPTGKVFSSDELVSISQIVQQYDRVITVSDEVYEYMCYNPKLPHISINSIEGMFNRTVVISSAGKTFSVTGWKIGWIVGPAHLVQCASIAHQWVTFSVCTPLQAAVANSLIIANQPYKGYNSYFEWLNADYKAKREFMCSALLAAGIIPIVPDGGFFIVGDTSNIQLPIEYSSDTSVTYDWALCRWLTIEIGVAAIPPSSFYQAENKSLAANYARFAFCKPIEVLQEAANRLLKCRKYLKKQ